MCVCLSPCRDRTDLAEVVALLKTQIDPALLKKEQETKPEGKRAFQYKNQQLQFSLDCFFSSDCCRNVQTSLGT